VLVVVSEERGSISFCFNGNIVSDLDGPRLRAALDGVFSPKTSGKKATPSRFWQLVPATLRKPRFGLGRTQAPSAERPSESPPSVRIRATPPPGISSPPPAAEPVSAAASTKPLRKAPAKAKDAAKAGGAASGGGASSSGSREASSVPPAPDETT
jgi:hypothetical protein